MGNCLVTKLKGTVDNDNLAKFGQTILKFNQTGGNDSLDWFDLLTNSNGEVAITSPNGGNYVIAGDGNPIPANTRGTGWLRKASSGITDFIFDSCYNVGLIYNVSYIHEAKGLGSLLYSLKGIHYSHCDLPFITGLFTELSRHSDFKYISGYSSPAISEDIVVAAINANINSLKEVQVNCVPASAVTNSSIIQIFKGCGNLEDLPITIRNFGSYDEEGYKITGNINTLITKWITAGRTSGTIYFNEWLTAFPNITINNGSEVISLASYMTSLGLNTNGTVYISWNAQGQITLAQGTAPADYVGPDKWTL